MNNENLTLHFKVKDFNAWRTSYNGHEKARASAGITNGHEVDVGQRLPVLVADDEAGVALVNGPRRREAARRHTGFGP